MTPSQVQAAPKTWDGGGADNLWSNRFNWSGDIPLLATDTVVFNVTSTKASTIDVNAIAGISINAGYTGITAIITQAAGTTLTVGGSPPPAT